MQAVPLEDTEVIQVVEGPKWKRWLLRAAVISFAGVLLAAIGSAVTILIIARDLPSINAFANYRPKQSTVVYGRDGQIVARFATERRTVVEPDRMPAQMIDAVIAAEDSDFFNHTGLDYLGMVRCAFKNIFSGRIACGASTITQQTVKTFLVGPKQTAGRKLREMILAKRVEDAIPKQAILYLYLNQIYFGHGAYGVQEAARVFFGKDVSRLHLEEIALLAGLPQSPSRLDPYRHPERAIARRAYVLGRLRALGKIDEETYKKAVDAPLRLDWSRTEADLDSSNHYASHVRTLLEGMVGQEAALDGGLKVYTGLDPEMQRAAERALREGLRDLDKRQGWRGPLLHLETNEMTQLRSLLDARRAKLGSIANGTRTSTNGATNGPVIWDLTNAGTVGQETRELDAILDATRFPHFEMEKSYGGLVIKVDDTGKEAVVDLGGGILVHLPMRTGLSWARKFDITRGTRAPKVPSEVLRTGDIVLVRATGHRKLEASEPKKKKGAKEPTAEQPKVLIGVLEQPPKVEAAFVAIDPATREVRAMVGGYGLGAGMFNRAVEARRQAGSTFKPMVYAAAFETKSYSPISPCLDAPRVYRDKWTGRPWKPENYDGKFDGEISLRTALTHSKNMCSVELIDHIEVKPVLDTAKRAGITSKQPENLTAALGSGDVTPLEMVNSYATFAAEGRYAPPIFIRKVVDAEGKTIFESKLEERQGLKPEIAYLVTSLMQSVVEAGTARAVKVLERPIAGKTGTSNESRNAWFIGYVPDLVAGVWVGFDNNDPLGPQETGGRAAIPIWLDFMKVALEKIPVRDFVVPPGIVFTYVDPKSGKLASPDQEGARYEPFLQGTEPNEFVEGARPPDTFGIDDFER